MLIFFLLLFILFLSILFTDIRIEKNKLLSMILILFIISNLQLYSINIDLPIFEKNKTIDENYMKEELMNLATQTIQADNILIEKTNSNTWEIKIYQPFIISASKTNRFILISVKEFLYNFRSSEDFKDLQRIKLTFIVPKISQESACSFLYIVDDIKKINWQYYTDSNAIDYAENYYINPIYEKKINTITLY